MFSKFLVALLALSPLAYAGNFMLMEMDGCDGSSCTDVLLITQSSIQPPGCNEMDSGRDVGGIETFINRQSFSGPACGVQLNFYWDGSQYNYYKNGGNGQALGWCEVESMSNHFCLADDAGGSYNAHGVAWCQNYDQTKNGVNPCVQ